MYPPVATDLSIEEFFDFELKSAVRHEYVDGQLRAMPYTSENHGLIVANLIGILYQLFLETECRVYPSDRMLRVETLNRFYSPDVMVVCGESEFYQHKKRMWATLNPVLVIEVLSEETELIDRYEKKAAYMQIPALKQYVIVSPWMRGIEVYNKTDNPNQLILNLFGDNNPEVEMLGRKIPVAEIFRNVKFAEKGKDPATVNEP